MPQHTPAAQRLRRLAEQENRYYQNLEEQLEEQSPTAPQGDEWSQYGIDLDVYRPRASAPPPVVPGVVSTAPTAPTEAPGTKGFVGELTDLSPRLKTLQDLLPQLLTTPLGRGKELPPVPDIIGMGLSDLLKISLLKFAGRTAKGLVTKGAGKGKAAIEAAKAKMMGKVPESVIPEIAGPTTAIGMGVPTIAESTQAVRASVGKELMKLAQQAKHEAKHKGIPARQRIEEALMGREELHPFLKAQIGKTARGLETGEDVFKLLKEAPSERELELFFVESLPPKGRLMEGIKATATKRVLETTPGRSAVGSFTPPILAAAAELTGRTTGLRGRFSEALETLERVGLKSPVGFRFGLPESVFSTEPAGRKFWSTIRDIENKWHSTERVLGDHIEHITKGLTVASLEKVGRFLDGQVVSLSAKEQATAAQLRTVFDRWANTLGLEPGRRITEYFPHIFKSKLGHPMDIVRTRAGQEVLADIEAGKLPIQITTRLSESARAEEALEALEKMSPDLLPPYFLKAEQALKNIPIETFWGPVSKRRLTNLPGETYNAREAALWYTRGASRKLYLDQTRAAYGKLLAGDSSTFMKEYAANFVDAFRGVDRGTTRMWATWADNMVTAAEEGGHKKAAELLRWLHPKRLSPAIREWEFAAKIAGNLATPLVNLSQTAINTVSEAGLGATLKAISMYVTQRAKVEPILRRAGVVYDANWAERMGTAPRLLKRVSDVLGYLFQASENANRGIAFLAGYNTARARGMGLAEAIKTGQRLVDNTQFIFQKSNIPLLAQSPFGAVILQFKTYMLNQLRWYHRVFRDGLFNPNGKNLMGRTNAQRLAAMLGTTFATGGAGAFLPTMSELYFMSNLKDEQLEPWIEDFILGGLPRIAGVDLSEMVGPSGILPAFASPFVDLERATREALGPAVSDTLSLMGIAGAEQTNLWLEAADGDPDAQKKLFKAILRALPVGGVQLERTFVSGADLPLGRRGRPLITEETPTERRLRQLFGARVTHVKRAVETSKELREAELIYDYNKKIAEEEILDNLQEYMHNPQKVAELRQKYAGMPFDDIFRDLLKRHEPLIVRQWDTMPLPVRRQFMLRHPRVVVEIIAAKQRAALKTKQEMGIQ